MILWKYSGISEFIADLIPPMFQKFINKIHRSVQANRIGQNHNGFFGNYITWEQARKECSGYDTDVIFAKVKAALLKVKTGHAAYERDSVLFDTIQY